MSFRSTVFASISLGFLTCAGTAQSAPWYTQATYSCDDAANLRPVLSSSPWFTRSLPLKFHNPASGKVYAELTTQAFIDLKKNGNQFERIMLDANRAASVRSILASRADQYDASVLFDVSADIVGTHALEVAGGAAAGTLIFSGLKAYLQGLANDQASTFRTYAAVIAKGGELRHVVRPAVKSYRPVLATSYVYDVKVGDEQRRIVLSSCVFPANVDIDEYDTRDGVNDLIVRRQGSIWRVYKKNNGAEWYPGFHLVEERADDDWLYLKSVDTNGTWHNQSHRISRVGGAWEKLDAGGWTRRYGKVGSALDAPGA